jgi:D-sedoheptulose 7-phosphate isomerase
MSSSDHDPVLAHLRALSAAAATAVGYAPTVSAWGAELARRFEAGGQLLTCGNGGSAAEAQHLTGEMVGRFRYDRRPLPAIALCADSAATTAIGNDYGIEEIFARQVRGHGRAGDVLVLLSTSGHSANLLAAADTASALAVSTYALCGRPGSPLAMRCDDAFCVDAPHTATVQEIHLVAIHLICAAVDEALAAGAGVSGAAAWPA